MRKWIIVTSIIGLFAVGCALVGPIMSKVEQPKYEVIKSVEDIEIRKYTSIIIAEVEVQGEREKAISTGFRMLADYIFGNNVSKQGIAMTAPVQQQVNEKIAMTAPVQQQFSGELWKVSFVMPSQYTIESLPQPNNKDVNIKEIPAKTYLVIKFSGTNSEGNISKHEKLLKQYAESNKIETNGLPKYAFYNPPWTLPFMRRNEIMLEIADKN